MARYRIFTPVLLLLMIFGCTQETTQSGSLNPTPFFEKLLDRAVLFTDSNKIEQAFNYLDSMYSAHGDKVTPADKYFYYNFYFNTLNRNGHPRLALPYADSMLDISQRGGKQKGKMLAEANYAKADALFSLQQYEDAYYYMYTAKQLVRENLDSCGISDYNYRLGMVLYKQRRYREAADEFKDAYIQSASCTSNFLYFYRRQELLDNIGLCYLNLKQEDSALIYFHEGLRFLQGGEGKFPHKSETVFQTARGVFYGNMADAYHRIGKTDTAEKLYQESIRINNTLYHDVIDAQFTRMKMATLYMETDRMAEAKKTLDEIEHLLNNLDNDLVRSKYYGIMWQYYEKEGNLQQAFYYLKKRDALVDSLARINKIFIETDISERFKNLDKQHVVSVLKRTNEIKETYLTGAILGGIMLMIILAQTYISWKRSKKNIKTLTQLNEHIKQQHKQLEVVLEELKLANNDKDRILRIVAHDVRNPIAAISALTDFMAMESDNLTAEQKEYIELMKEACTNALTLTKEILDAASSQNTDILEKEWVDINTLLHNCIGLLKFKAADKSQSLELTTLPESTPLYIDKEKIWRVINNLIVNAIKFSESNTVIQIKAQRLEGYVIISIADHGIGIPQKNQDKVFDMFTEAKRNGTQGEKSYGLGLSISRKIMLDHGGKIWFESSEETGTTFYISLPVQK